MQISRAMLEYIILFIFPCQAGFSVFQQNHLATPRSQKCESMDGLKNKSENDENHQIKQNLENNIYKTNNNFKKNEKRKIRRDKGNKKRI